MGEIVCPVCKKRSHRSNGHINRSKKLGAPLYCNREYAGIARRENKTLQQKKEEKRLYDMGYRKKNLSMLKKKKSQYYQRTRDPVKEAKIRKERMHLHIAYCQRPEYKEWKKKYDRKHRCKEEFGEFWEAASVLLDVENEIDSRISRYEVYQQNGTLNKHLRRRREYDKIINA